MKIKFLTVLIARSMATKIPREVRAYELPILEQVHGSDSLEVVDERFIDADPVDAGSELQRLESLYGTHAKRDIPFARMAFRNADELEDAIIDATLADDETDGDVQGVKSRRRAKPADPE